VTKVLFLSGPSISLGEFSKGQLPVIVGTSSNNVDDVSHNENDLSVDNDSVSTIVDDFPQTKSMLISTNNDGFSVDVDILLLLLFHQSTHS
jgi:hypothetical protein